MRGRVKAGAFRGGRLVLRQGDLCVRLRREHLPLERLDVASVRVLNMTERPGLVSGCLRGWLTRNMSVPVWFASVRSAALKRGYLVMIQYKSGARSVAEMDEACFCALAAVFGVIE